MEPRWFIAVPVPTLEKFWFRFRRPVPVPDPDLFSTVFINNKISTKSCLFNARRAETALVPRKLLWNFWFLDFCVIFYVGPGPKPDPEPECIAVPVSVPPRQKLRFRFQNTGSSSWGVSPGGKVDDLVGHGAGQAAVLPHCNSQTLSKIDQLLSSECTYVDKGFKELVFRIRVWIRDLLTAITPKIKKVKCWNKIFISSC